MGEAGDEGRKLDSTQALTPTLSEREREIICRMSDSILIVDDERGIRETLSAVLRDEGFAADAVATGEECLKAIEQRAYGCVLLDVWLPGINGLETLSQLRN